MKHPRKIAAAVNFSACQHYQLCAIVTGFFTFHVTEHVRCFKILSLSDDISQIYFLQGKIISYICATWHHVFKIKLGHATGMH